VLYNDYALIQLITDLAHKRKNDNDNEKKSSEQRRLITVITKPSSKIIQAKGNRKT
jgi:hypothetical protein